MRRRLDRFLPIILILVGIMWTVIGLKTLRNHREFPQTTAAITDIQEEQNSATDDWDYHVFVRYTADGSSYEGELGSYHAGYKVGKKIKISYNPADPTEIQAGGIGESLLFLIGGPLISAGGVILLLKRGL